jgi:hypothetical protein
MTADHKPCGPIGFIFGDGALREATWQSESCCIETLGIEQTLCCLDISLVETRGPSSNGFDHRVSR